MKRIAWLALLVGCISFMVVGAAAATFPPAGQREVAHWEWDENVGWVGFSPDLTTPSIYDSLARCFATGDAEGSCNQKVWRIPVDIHASVAQWVKWDLDGTDWHWYILKPGKYAADCINYEIYSNQRVRLDFNGFGHLHSGKSATDISIWYSEGDYSDPPLPTDTTKWLTPTQLNDYYHIFPDSPEFHYSGAKGKLWCMIEVVECNSACEYVDYAEIVLTLACQKDWVDWDTGGWIDA